MHVPYLTLLLAALMASAWPCSAQGSSAPLEVQPAPIKALVLEGEGESSFTSRVLGQLSGAGIAVDSAQQRSEVRALSLREQLAEARRLANAAHASIVAWLDTRDGVVLTIAVLGERARIVRRRLSKAGELDSAGLEGAALLVRSVALLVQEGELVGNDAEATVAQEAPVEKPAPPQPSPSAEKRKPAARAASDVRWSAAVAVGLVALGSEEPAAPNLVLSPELSLRPFRGALSAAVGLPVDLESDYGAVELTRHQLVALLGYDFVAQPSGRVSVLLGPGLLWLGRRTTATSATSGAAERSSHVIPQFSAELRAALVVPGGAQRPGVEASVGADLLARQYSVAADLGGVTRAVHELWRIQPRACVGVVLDF